MNRTINPPSKHTENAGSPEMEGKMLRIEHDCIAQYIAAYLQDGKTYTIQLKGGDPMIENVVFHLDSLFNYHYFKMGTSAVYPIENVYCHSFYGHELPASPQPTLTEVDPNRLAITDDYDEVIKVVTTPETNPITYQRRVRCLMISGLPQAYAEHIAATEPMKLEIFYDIGLGCFAIDAEAVGNTPLYNPYTGAEIPDETE